MTEPHSIQLRRLSPRSLKFTTARLLGLLLAALVLGAPGASLAQAPSVSATLDDGVNAGTYAQDGDTLDYTTVISNSGAGNATGVTLTNPTPADTTLVPGSVHASPLANHDGPYTAVGNTKLYVGVAAPAGEPALVSASPALFANDTTITDTTSLASFTQPANGAVTVNSNGSFVYTPTAGFTGADSFTYTLQNDAEPPARFPRAAGPGAVQRAPLNPSQESSEIPRDRRIATEITRRILRHSANFPSVPGNTRVGVAPSKKDGVP